MQRQQILERQGASFDVGQLQAEDRQKIPLAMVKPLLLRPVVINPDVHGDLLGLMAALRKRLREENYSAARGESNGWNAVFLDEEDFPGAIRPFATYTVARNQATLNITLWRDAQKLAVLDIVGLADERDALIRKIIQAITGFVGKKP